MHISLKNHHSHIYLHRCASAQILCSKYDYIFDYRLLFLNVCLRNIVKLQVASQYVRLFYISCFTPNPAQTYFQVCTSYKVCYIIDKLVSLIFVAVAKSAQYRCCLWLILPRLLRIDFRIGKQFIQTSPQFNETKQNTHKYLFKSKYEMNLCRLTRTSLQKLKVNAYSP